jgi:phage gpG-like protein
MSVEVIDHSDEVIRLLSSATTKALEEIGLVAEGHAKKKAPVDTGNLRNSITHVVEGDAAYIGTNVEYAPYQEYGFIHYRSGKRVQGKHYLRDAATGHTSQYRAILKKNLENA